MNAADAKATIELLPGETDRHCSNCGRSHDDGGTELDHELLAKPVFLCAGSACQVWTTHSLTLISDRQQDRARCQAEGRGAAPMTFAELVRRVDARGLDRSCVSAEVWLRKDCLRNVSYRTWDGSKHHEAGSPAGVWGLFTAHDSEQSVEEAVADVSESLEDGPVGS